MTPRTTSLKLLLGTAALVAIAAAAGAPAAWADGQPTKATPGVWLLSPAITIAELSPGGTEVHAQIISTEPTTFSYTVTLTAAPSNSTIGGAVRVPVGAVLSNAGAPPPQFYDVKHSLYKTGLTPNTMYDLDVSGVTRSGVQVSAHASFTTLKQRLRLTLKKIDVSDDGDTFGSGEPSWFWKVGWSTDSVTDCYPEDNGHCRTGSASEGTIYPYTDTGQTFAMVFAQENFQPIVNPNPQPGREDFTTMPQELVLDTAAKEDDGIFGWLDAAFDWGAWLSGNQEVTWTVPEGVEYATKTVTVGADDGNFRSTMTFTFEVFYDNQVYTPNDGRVYSTSK